jgi:hypothetical protein
MEGPSRGGRLLGVFSDAASAWAVQAAIESGLPDKDVKAMCLKYAALEKKLQEIDRARAIYVHASQLADPRTDPAFWQEWNDFEVRPPLLHGAGRAIKAARSTSSYRILTQ